MSTKAFQKALCQLPLSREERATLTSDELFILLLAQRLAGLTSAEQARLESVDLQYLVSAGLIANGVEYRGSALGAMRQTNGMRWAETAIPLSAMNS